MKLPAVFVAGTAMDLVKPSRAGRVIARMVLAFLLGGAAFLMFVPWQQTAKGDGRVIAYSPQDRQQNIKAPIEGKVTRWLVTEGSQVKAGDPIVDLSDNDPDILQRLGAERDAVLARLAAANMRVKSIEAQITALQGSRKNAVSAAESRIKMANRRMISASQALAAADATLATAELNSERQQALYGKGLTSQRQLELTVLEETRARTESERAKAALDGAHAELSAIGSDREKVSNDAFASIESAQAAKALADAEIASANAELTRIDVRLARQASQAVRAPIDGTVLSVIANGQSGEFVKAGEILAVIVPDTTDRAVEVWVSGNDMPLVSPGAKVRLQFEGWPVLQFSGWPSVAVGTFGAIVKFVDATNNKDGDFRVVMVPDPNDPWPAASYLRQGVRVHAWIQLGVVSVGYELWRQFNGFPPSLPNAPSGSKPNDAMKGAKK